MSDLLERFARIDTWVFDLDNTLYPQTADLWPKIDARITLFMMRLFGLDALSLRALQKLYCGPVMRQPVAIYSGGQG